MRSIARVFRFQELAVPREEPIDNVSGDLVSRDQNGFAVIGNGDQAPVEHPVQGARKSQPVTHGIASLMRYGTDMSRLHLRTAAAIAQPQARHRASVPVGFAYSPAKRHLSVRSACQPFKNGTLEDLGRVPQLELLMLIARRLHPFEILRQAEFQYPGEIRLR